MKTCKRCHEVKPLADFNRDKTQKDGLDTWCKACGKDYRKEYRAKHPDRLRVAHEQYALKHKEAVKAYKEAWAQRNQEHLAEQRRAYYQANKGQLRQRNDEYRQAHRSTVLERQRQYYSAHKEQWSQLRRESYQQHRAEILERARLYREKNKAYLRVRSRPIVHARRARLAAGLPRSAPQNNFTLDQWLELCEQSDHRCLACGQQEPLTVDHVIPLALGGTNDISNIQPLCGRCNARKGRRIMDYRARTTPTLLEGSS